MRKAKLPQRTEHQEQVALMKLCSWGVGPYKDAQEIFAIPNAGKRSMFVGRQMKAEGLRVGVPDLFLPVARHRYYGLFIEMKRRDGGVASEAQADRINRLRLAGYFVAVCPGADAAWAVIKHYLTLLDCTPCD